MSYYDDSICYSNDNQTSETIKVKCEDGNSSTEAQVQIPCDQLGLPNEQVWANDDPQFRYFFDFNNTKDSYCEMVRDQNNGLIFQITKPEYSTDPFYGIIYDGKFYISVFGTDYLFSPSSVPNNSTNNQIQAPTTETQTKSKDEPVEYFSCDELKLPNGQVWVSDNKKYNMFFDFNNTDTSCKIWYYKGNTMLVIKDSRGYDFFPSTELYGTVDQRGGVKILFLSNGDYVFSPDFPSSDGRNENTQLQSQLTGSCDDLKLSEGYWWLSVKGGGYLRFDNNRGVLKRSQEKARPFSCTMDSNNIDFIFDDFLSDYSTTKLIKSTFKIENNLLYIKFGDIEESVFEMRKLN